MDKLEIKQLRKLVKELSMQNKELEQAYYAKCDEVNALKDELWAFDEYWGLDKHLTCNKK